MFRVFGHVAWSGMDGKTEPEEIRDFRVSSSCCFHLPNQAAKRLARQQKFGFVDPKAEQEAKRAQRIARFGQVTSPRGPSSGASESKAGAATNGRGGNNGARGGQGSWKPRKGRGQREGGGGGGGSNGVGNGASAKGGRKKQGEAKPPMDANVLLRGGLKSSR